MSRQDEPAATRVPFFFYIDEFHHFVTPSLAAILSSARKYGLGLTLAHQETRQLRSRNEDVASAVLANAYTRIVFRVGEQDAKTLSDGFSFFDPADLQNLGVGEAVARIERRDFDFNLRTSGVNHVDQGLADAQRKAVVAASRTKYATPRVEVEALLRNSRDTETDVTPERPKRSPSARKAAPEPEVPFNPRSRISQPSSPVEEDRSINICNRL